MPATGSTDEVASAASERQRRAGGRKRGFVVKAKEGLAGAAVASAELLALQQQVIALLREVSGRGDPWAAGGAAEGEEASLGGWLSDSSPGGRDPKATLLTTLPSAVERLQRQNELLREHNKLLREVRQLGPAAASPPAEPSHAPHAAAAVGGGGCGQDRGVGNGADCGFAPDVAPSVCRGDGAPSVLSSVRSSEADLQRPAVCARCGNKFKADSEFCRKCGLKRPSSGATAGHAAGCGSAPGSISADPGHCSS